MKKLEGLLQMSFADVLLDKRKGLDQYKTQTAGLHNFRHKIRHSFIIVYIHGGRGKWNEERTEAGGKEEEEVAVSDRRIFRKTSLCMHDVFNSGFKNNIEKIFCL